VAEALKKWRVVLDVEEDVVREFHEQGRDDPGTTDVDVQDAFQSFLSTAGDEYDLELDPLAGTGISFVEVSEAPEV
jgi:hypothetical protein